MKLMKRATALLLCFLMLTNGPISAVATEGVSDNDVVVETTTATEIVEVCEECGGSDAHTDDCSFNIVAPLTTEAPDETTESTTTPSEETTTTTTVVTESTVTTGSAISSQAEVEESIVLDFLPAGLVAESESVADTTAVITANPVTLYKSLDNGAEGIEVTVESGTVIDLITKYTFTTDAGELVFYRYDYCGSNEALNDAALSEYSGYVFIYSEDISIEDIDQSGDSESSGDITAETEKTDTATGVVLSAELPEDITLSVSAKTIEESGLDTTAYPVDGASLFYDVTLYQNNAEYQAENGVTITFPEAAITNSGLTVGDSYKVYHIHDGATDVTGPFKYTGGSISVDFANLSVVGIAEADAAIDMIALHGEATVTSLSENIVLAINSDSVTLYDGYESNVYTAEFTGAAGIEVEAYMKVTFTDGFVLYQYAYYGDDADIKTAANTYQFIASTDVNDVTDTTEREVSKTLGIHTLSVSGVLPDGVGLDAAELEADMSDFIHSGLLDLDALTENEMALAYDISLQVGENKVQPNGTVTVKLDGLDTSKYTDFTVYHLPNTDTETIRKVMDGETIMLDAPETLTPVTVGDGYIEFETDGFSIYYIVGGSLSDNSGNDTFYILRGAAVELTNVTTDNYTVTYPEGVTAENSGVTMVRSGNTLTVTATSSAQYGTYTVKISNNRTATIIVLTPLEIFNVVNYNEVYFTCVRDSTNVPSEPMSGGDYSWTYFTDINNGQYSFTNSWGSAFQNSPDGFLNLDVIANSDSLEQNLQGQNVIGVIDRGWGADTLPCVNYTDEQWHELLKQFVAYTTVQISDGAGGTVTLTSSMVDEKLENGTYRYKMYPYVVKLILESSEYQKGWHVDCAIVDTKTYSVSYEYNLPSTAVLQESSDLIKPEMAFYSPGTDDVEVGVMTLGRNNVTGDTSVTVYDTNTQSTSEYKFLYWNTAPDGSGTSYNPNDTLPPITENIVLYAIWNHTQTSGSLKLEKTEVFEDANDDRKDDGISYTFTITFANAEAGKSYPYTFYNADDSVKSAENSFVSGGTVTLKHGEYIIVNNVPGGSVTVSESVATDSEFDVSWQVADSNTAGDTVTATVVAGAQTEIVCTNTYEKKTGTLVIEKTVTKAYDNDTLPNDTFTFTVSGAGITDGTSYTYKVDGGADQTAIAADGKISISLSDFTVGVKKTITINDIPAGNYTVTENTNDNYTTTVTGLTNGIVNVPAGGTGTVSFTNEYKRHLADLTITKTGWNATDENQSYIFTVTGPNGFTMDVVINENGSVTIKDLPIGEYTVTENTNWSWRYTPDGGKSKTIKLAVDDKNEVTFDNKRSWIYWLSGDSYNENQFTVKPKDEDE